MKFTGQVEYARGWLNQAAGEDVAATGSNELHCLLEQRLATVAAIAKALQVLKCIRSALRLWDDVVSMPACLIASGQERIAADWMAPQHHGSQPG